MALALGLHAAMASRTHTMDVAVKARWTRWRSASLKPLWVVMHVFIRFVFLGFTLVAKIGIPLLFSKQIDHIPLFLKLLYFLRFVEKTCL
jgi:hypothetical protein